MNWDLFFFKKSPRQPLLTEANIFKHQNWAKKIDFSKVISTDISRVIFDVPDGWIDFIQFKHACDKKKPLRGGSVMKWAVIVDETIIKPDKFNEGVKMNSANY